MLEQQTVSGFAAKTNEKASSLFIVLIPLITQQQPQLFSSGKTEHHSILSALKLLWYLRDSKNVIGHMTDTIVCGVSYQTAIMW